MRRIRTEHFSSETVREARTKINSNQERFNSSNEFMHIMWTAFFLGAICQDNKFVRLKQFQKLVLRASSRFQTLETTTSTRPFHLSGNLWLNTNYEGFLNIPWVILRMHKPILHDAWVLCVVRVLKNAPILQLYSSHFWILTALPFYSNMLFHLITSDKRSFEFLFHANSCITRASWWPGKKGCFDCFKQQS